MPLAKSDSAPRLGNLTEVIGSTKISKFCPLSRSNPFHGDLNVHQNLGQTCVIRGFHFPVGLNLAVYSHIKVVRVKESVIHDTTYY